jgi:hypothetical protein
MPNPTVSFPGYDLAPDIEQLGTKLVLPSLTTTGKIALTTAGQPTLSLTNNVETIVPGSMQFGLLLIEETGVSGNVGFFLIAASFGAVLIAQSSGALFSVATNTASKLNVYWNGTNIVIQNKVGADRLVRILPIQIG